MTRLLFDSILVISLSVVAVGIIVLAGVRDASMSERKIDCRILIGSWHPDVPKEVIQECRKRNNK
jgi:hypothetical protein